MDKKELTDLLVLSSENFNQTKFIPWWVEDYHKFTYRYRILNEETVRAAEGCAAECRKEDLLSPAGSLGLTLFHLLVLHNFYDAVEKMLCDGRIKGEEINRPDHKGYGLTPFLLACSRGNLAMVRLLLEHGADDAACDKRGMNAYHFLANPKFEGRLACDFASLERSVEQRAETARLLTCDINQKNGDGLTPLEQLLSTENNAAYTWTLPEVFLEKGAKTDYVNREGSTLLMMALENGHRTAAFQLMRRCPELIHVGNKDGVTPIRYAEDYREDVLRFVLEEYGAMNRRPMDINELAEIAERAFGRISIEKRDGLDLALYLAEKLIRQADPDDDDEAETAADILPHALRGDEKSHILDIYKDAGFSFTMPVRCYGGTTCLRDKCLDAGYGTGVLKKLAELGVDMEQAVSMGRTPVCILASDDRQADREGDGERENYYEKAAEFFSKESMEQTDNQGKAAIHYAVKNGRTGMLRVMIEKGVDVNLTEDAPSEAGITPLHLACAYGRGDMAKMLIAAGADDTRKNLYGETPAHFVFLKKCEKELELKQKAELLKELKHLDVPGEDGRTPLMLLTDMDRELLSVFLDRGVDVNHADMHGRTALMFYRDKDMAKALLRAGADINRADNEGNTALHYALESGAEGTARYLIRKGADYGRPNNQGRTPAQIAVEKGFEAALNLMTDIV